MTQVVLKRGDFGTYLVEAADGSQSLLMQVDYDYPCLASHMGKIPCEECSETDGTVDCKHKTASQMIGEARDFLDDHIGEVFEDPGYFDKEAQP